MRIARLVVVAVVLWSVSGVAAAQRGSGALVVGELGSKLDAAATASARYYWGAVLVATAGEPVFARGFGALDRSLPKRGKAPPDMPSKALFDLGGASELLTRMLALQLQQEGKLNLAEPVDKYLEDWPDDKHLVTLQNLVDQASGLPISITWPNGIENSPRATAKLIGEAPLEQVPFDESRYSMLNPIVLALAIESSVDRFDKLLEDRVLEPFGMKSAGNRGKSFSRKLLTTRRSPQGSDIATAANYTWRHRGATGILASVHDVHALLAGITGGKLLDTEQRDLVLRPGGAGQLAIREVDVLGQRLLQIEGSCLGYRTRWTLHPASRSWVVLCGGADTPLDELEIALLGELAVELGVGAGNQPGKGGGGGGAATAAGGSGRSGAASGGGGSPDRFLGTFALPAGGRFRVARAGAGLSLIGEGAQAAVRLVEGEWPGRHGAFALRAEDRGIALLERLVSGDATVVDEAFASAAKAEPATRALAGFVSGHGDFERIEFLGVEGVKRGATETWFRLVCARGAVNLRVGWQGGERFDSVTLAGDEPPFCCELTVIAPDRAVAKSPSGRELRLTVEGTAAHRTLVFEDATLGEEGLLDCREVE